MGTSTSRARSPIFRGLSMFLFYHDPIDRLLPCPGPLERLADQSPQPAPVTEVTFVHRQLVRVLRRNGEVPFPLSPLVEHKVDVPREVPPGRQRHGSPVRQAKTEIAVPVMDGPRVRNQVARFE